MINIKLPDDIKLYKYLHELDSDLFWMSVDTFEKYRDSDHYNYFICGDDGGYFWHIPNKKYKTISSKLVHKILKENKKEFHDYLQIK